MSHIVECDACGTKNKIADGKETTARCGRCRNPLQDALEEQLGLQFSSNGVDPDGVLDVLSDLFGPGFRPNGKN